MAFRQMRTLDEMVSDVLDRCGLGIQGGLTSDLQPQIRSFLKQAQRMFWLRFPHLRNRTRLLVPLVVGQTLYDLPDIFDVGSIDQVTVKDSTGREWPLETGISASDRTAANVTATAIGDQPQRYDIHDGQIELIAAPTSSVPSMYILGFFAESPLIEGKDRPAVDDEACVQFAVIELKRFKRMFTTSEAMAEHSALLEGYVNDVDTAQGTGEVTQMGTGYVDPMDVITPIRQRPWWLANRRP